MISEGAPSPQTSTSSADHSANGSPSTEFLDRIPLEFARQHLILSAGRDGEVEHLLIAERTTPVAVFNTRVRLGIDVQTTTSDEAELARRIDESYAVLSDPAPENDPEEQSETLDDDVEELLALADRDLLSTEGKGPVVRLVDTFFFQALTQGASDIHVQPLAQSTLVRFRIDGVLQTVRELPPRLNPPLVSRIKVMGQMDIAERRIPQDGRATVSIGEQRAVDLRISTLPTSHGERAVIRLLDAGHGPGLEDFASLGMPAEAERVFLAGAGRSSGIVLVTGPTGSGKTTTLYTTLRWLAGQDHGRAADTGPAAFLDGGDLNIMTIEDPIEYELATTGIAISQAQVNTKKGVTFASGLRHILRQDPDVIMVGEIRDAETARTAIQASLTGHLVFSTLHTNDAASAVTRLLDLGIEPYLVASSLSAVLAQRLLRLLHADCQGKGCAECFRSGYKGRTAIFEMLPVEDELRDLINAGSPATTIRAWARTQGVRSLEQEGQELVDSQSTSASELQRVVGGLA